MAGKTIQTGVDTLFSLIQEEEKISVKEAAKRLNASVSTVSEWGAFLEEEGLINIEYRFTTPYLVKRKLSNEQVLQLKEKVREEQDIFRKKTENTLNYLNKLEIEVDSLKEIFDNIGKHFRKQLSDVKDEFGKLKDAEEEQDKLNDELVESKQKFIKRIADVNKHLLKEETNYRKVYDFLFAQVEMENKILKIQEDELKFIKETDKILRNKLKQIKSRIAREKKKVSKKMVKKASRSESELSALEKKYLNIKESLDKESKVVEELLTQNELQGKQNELLQKDVLSKMKESLDKVDKTLKEAKETPKKLKLFMSKKNKVLGILNKISYNEKMLRDKFDDLMKRSNVLKSKDSKESIKEIQKLEKELENITKKKGFFEKEIKKIFKLLKL